MKAIFLLFVLMVLSCNENLNRANKEETVRTIVDSPRVIRKIKPRLLTDTTNVLDNKTRTLRLEYTVWGCSCPHWKIFDATIKSPPQIENHFYIEAAKEVLKVSSDNFDPFKQLIIVEGQFYKREDYPAETYEEEEPALKAKVFRYHKIKIVDKFKSVK